MKMIRLFHALLLAAALGLAGCAFVTVPLFSPTRSLEERVIEGQGNDKILLIDISGFISQQKKSGFSFEKGTSMTEDIKEALQKAEGDDAVKGLIVRINSPGGTITGSDILHHELVRFRKTRNVPITACLMDMGTSGAYYVAAAADEIIAHPTTITGSFAVIAMKFNVKGLLDMVGIKEETIQSGALKDIWSPFRPSTEEEKKIMQAIIDTFHERFVAIILNGRRALTRESIEKLADGRIFSADQALEAKLIDGIGYVDDAIDSLKKSLGIDEAKIIVYGRPGSYKETVYSGAFPLVPRTLSLIDGVHGGLLSPPGVQFMYLWAP